MSVDLPPVKIKQNTYQGIRTVIYSIDNKAIVKKQWSITAKLIGTKVKKKHQ